MKGILCNVRLSGILLMVALMITGCFFGSSLDVFVSGVEGDTLFVSFSTNSTTSLCNSDGETRIFSCAFFYSDTEQNRISTFVLTGYELSFLLILLDPLVVQLPMEASNFQGAFLHQTSGDSGNLVIRSGLTSLRGDATRTYQAEPGMQLVVIDLPNDAPTEGRYSFNFNFNVPDNLDSLEVKALYTGKVEVEGETYYLPLLPCTTDLTAVPSFSIPLPQGGSVPLPTNVQGCDNVTFTLKQDSFDNYVFLPFVDQ